MSFPRDPDEPRIPSPLQAIGLWLTAVLAALVAGTGSALLAGLWVAGPGEDLLQVLADPARSPLANHPTWITLGTLGNELAVFAALALWVVLLRPSRARVFPLGRVSVWTALGAVLLVFGLAPLAEVLAELVRRGLHAEVTAATIIIAAAKGAGPFGLVLLLIVVALVPAVVEEAVFRGFITSAFSTPLVSLLVPSVLFGLFHIEPTQAAGTMVLGVGFAVARVYSGSLVPAMIAHGVYNATVILSVRYGAAEQTHEIEPVYVLVGLVIAAAGYTLLWRERRKRLSFPATEGSRPPPPA